MIKTLIFDIGKVIVDFDHAKIIQNVVQHCEFNEAEIQQTIFSTDLTKDYELGKISSLEFCEGVKKALNLQMNFAEFDSAWNSTFNLTPILPNEMFEKLSNQYRLLILSDTNEMHFEFIRANFDALNYFDDFVLSYQVGALKPSKEIFEATIEKAKCLPSECLFTDDRLPNVEGAKLCGIDGILFETAEKFEKGLDQLKNL